MARKEKMLEEISCTYNEEDIDRREVGYYATPEFISNYISLRMLQINNNGTRVLDPCCGKEELLSFFFDKGLSIDGIDIIRYKDKYKCNFENIDFINYYCNKKDSSISGLTHDNIDDYEMLELDYDYYIANPPYNCHEVDFIKNNKGRLKKYFSDVGVHNMYSMFISAIIDLAKQDAVIGLITHDSFLTSKYHEGLRKKILNECTVHEITMCSTDLFLSQGADVRTSIVILQKGKKHQGEVIVNNRSLNTQKLKEVLDKNIKREYSKKYSLNDIILNNEKDNTEFIIECPDDIKSLFYKKRLGQILKCVTGISTGNDKLYLSEKMEEPFTIPFYKNPGKDRFYTNKYIYLHEDFLKFDKEIKNFMVRNKPLLFKSGITCSSMGVEFTASKLPSNSTFGVNANIICDEYDSWWLLAYLNSTLVTYLVRGLLIRSNMITSGYVSRIPIINLTKEEKDRLICLSKEAYELAANKKSISYVMLQIDNIVNMAAKISKETIISINNFKDNLVKNT
ncbi:N-6 DNA methylase [Clostridium sp.]|uniref:N-6 DNA methylase n=1 Tax=Clostridium sp. TaxID=1506 RepID=UPI001D9E388C|nr:N-6 DNA methylase [Clostridium sp.]MBS5940060.1 N-6 DNA methylase [Clostridium sp.]